MFYLLEDNRIIDSEKYINSILNKGKNSEKNYEYLYEIRNGQSYYYGKIKKQSENVFDLIEKTDLLKVKFGDSFNILEVSHIGGGVSGMRGIIAIYKSDTQGNYIKVWEKKDD